MLPLILSVAALVLAGAALGLAIVLLRQSGEALGSIRSHLRRHERTLDPEVAEDRQQLTSLTEWAQRADEAIAELDDALDVRDRDDERGEALVPNSDRHAPDHVVVTDEPPSPHRIVAVLDDRAVLEVPANTVRVVDADGREVWRRPVDQPATAHLERHDLPTSAMPAPQRPEPRPRSATGLDGTATP